ncbi:MAG: hypothetical protein JSV85_00050 [Candidatus Bathyarchaeota archaeon]|nr:MAG: hypothetical protein JSV85_00050 [Candidatus Bathyarchaeota archaeon]
MKNGKNLFGATLLTVLLISIAFPSTILVSAQEDEVQATWRTRGRWTYIENDMITIAFPANGEKPMFLWWFTEDPENINVVKYKGLIEYIAFDTEYFIWRHLAEAWRIRERIQAHYYEPIRHRIQSQLRLKAILRVLSEIGNHTGLHSPYLPFGGCRWELSSPMNVTKSDTKYLSFNFTLVDVPDYRPNLQFAENNIIIRCRFYYTSATEDVEGRYTYTMDAGELKMDLVVKHWDWNVDKLKPLLEELREEEIDVPDGKAGLALWINLASLDLLKLAEDDAATAEDTSITETASTTRNIYVEGQSVSVTQNRTGLEDEQPLQSRARERFKFRFEKGNTTFAGFFKFVPKALIRDPVNNTVIEDVDVTASYIAAGRHMRVFLAYPYFGSNALEHDPSLGVESLPQLITPSLVVVLIGATAMIAVVILVVRWTRKMVNVVGV